MNQAKVSLYAVGDFLARRENPESLFALAAPTLKQADILFGQTENVFSDRAPEMHSGGGDPAPTWKVSALKYAGYHVMSAASNHCLDFGESCLLDSIAVLRKNGIAVIGAGKDINEARRPAILERNGARIAFLGYCSVLPRGYQATGNKPGSAPMRASTAYEQYDWQAGMPPRVLSFADREDLECLTGDIRKVRPLADVVVLSMHWGVHIVPAVVAAYQKEVAHAAIDAGADLILGHHTHILKGIEVYRGKVIFYSLGNFAMDGRPLEAIRRDPTWKELRWKLDPENPSYPYPADSRKTVIAKCVISGKKIEKVSYLPVMINKQSQPEVLPASDQRSAEVFDYMKWLCNNQDLDAEFSQEGDEVVISSPPLKKGD
ncbi:MAG: CapA family protein [Chloroflexi bacterium]|nr:CapA family protein [Chloroflexota bacterium]